MNERERVQELLGAYVLGHLDGEELEMVEAALAEDERLREEVDELRAVADLLPLVGEQDLLQEPVAGEVPDDLADGVVEELLGDRRPSSGEATSGPPGTTDGDAASPGRSAARRPSDRSDAAPRGPAGRRPGDGASRRRSRALVPLAGLILIAAVGLGVVLQTGEPDPGLGVEEPVEFAVAPPDLEVEASLVPHTWGTEVFLEMTGLVDGEIYLVELETDGDPVSAGTFIGDGDLEVVCVMNGAALREDVNAIVITTEDGEPVMRAELGPVDYRSV